MSDSYGIDIKWCRVFVGGEFVIENARLDCLGGPGFKGFFPSIDFCADIKEIHYKPKTKIDLNFNCKISCYEVVK